MPPGGQSGSGSGGSGAPPQSGTSMTPVTEVPLPAEPAAWTPGGGIDQAAAAAAPHGTIDNTVSGVSGVVSNFGQSWSDGLTAFTAANSPLDPSRPETTVERAQRGARQIRAVQGIMSNVMAAISLPQDILNVGFANLTNSIAAMFPAFPAAFLGSPYLGMPHAHSHPPSLIPPAPPVPLPSIGMITLGTCLKVLISNMPAARCGDIGVAPTCGGLQPFFQIKTGSSKVFIGGNRAARMLDICAACTMADDRKIEAGKVMAAVGKAASAASTALEVAGYAVGVVSVVADAAEAATEDDPSMAAAKGMAAAMGAAQMAADAAAAIITKSMGTDPGIPPGTKGAVMVGNPTVLIGGFPMVNIPNPVNMVLDKLKRYVPKKPAAPAPEAPGPKGCP